MTDFVDEQSAVGVASIERNENDHITDAKWPQSTNFKLAVAHEEMNPRRRNTMEDVHRIVHNLIEKPDGNVISYFGVYDGHGGRQIVDFMETALEQNVAAELQLPDEAGVLERLSRAFLITDMQSRKLNIVAAGATAVVALISGPASDRVLHVANVGDSRAVLVCEIPGPDSELEDNRFNYYARRLTFDHRATDPGEQARIRAAGGFVMRDRVLGILAVSRSFGDHGMKDFVCAQPYTTETQLSTCGAAPFLILACDGVWDVFTDQEAADLLLEEYFARGSVPFDDAAQMLVQASIDRGSADNVTVIVVFL